MPSHIPQISAECHARIPILAKPV